MQPTFIVQLILSVIIGIFSNPLVEYIKDGTISSTVLGLIIVLVLCAGKVLGQLSAVVDNKEPNDKVLK
jgi:predicted PurR-regulated permease PerM